MSKVGTVLEAAGSSTRTGGVLPKQFRLLGGRPMFVAALDSVLGVSDEVVVVAPADNVARAKSLLEKSGIRCGRAGDETTVNVVPGGERRQDSVLRGLAILSPRIDIVLVHDAARPFATEDLAARVIAAAEAAGACVPAVPIPETVKRVESGDDRSCVLTTLDRSFLRLVQTPQGFRRSVLDQAYRGLRGLDVTDDASAVELAGHAVAVIDGEPGNTKVTTADDLEAAETRANRRLGLDATARVGDGFDLHRLVEGRDLILCGVRIPFDRGLDGHSDADVATHAVCDALLGAVAAGDIGTHFPPSDPRFKGASSLGLLGHVVELVHRGGFVIGNVDVTIVAEEPKLAHYVDGMRRTLAEALGVTPSSVSVKATTTEGAGPEGRGEAMSARAVAVVRELRAATRGPSPDPAPEDRSR